MLKFHADKFVSLASVMRSVTLYLIGDPDRFNDPAKTDEERAMLALEIAKAITLLEGIGLRQSVKKAKKIGQQLKFTGHNAAHFSVVIDELMERIKDELEDQFCLVLDANEAGLFAPNAIALVGEEIVKQFPSLVYEIEESAKCGALGRDTASAFHAIRCLEAAIRAISRCLQIPDPTKGADRSWYNLLKKIEDAMKVKWPNSAERFSGDGKLFEEFHATLHAMQNPYRNATMHLDAKYSPAEAQVIRIVVKELLAKVSARMNEEGLPNA
jgi:hypothetical protein